jgi:polyisoprenoid-binding protein YceI
MARLARRWKYWVGGGVGALALVLAGGPFVYIHFVEGKAPSPLNLSSTTTTPAGTPASNGAAPASVDGEWKITTGQAGYRIHETLFGQSNTAVGRTTAVTGTITIAGTKVTAGSFTVDMTAVHSDQSRRDSQFQGRIMDTATYPTATFRLTGPIRLAVVPADGTQITASATGDLSLHGTTRSVTFPVTARRTGAAIAVSGSISITFADWNIANPSFGPTTTDDHGTLEFLLTFGKG